MSFERYLAHMNLDKGDGTDSFPERHAADLGDMLLRDSEMKDIDDIDPEALANASRRPPRGPQESPDGFEMRGRYWDAARILHLDLAESKRPPEVWDFVYDPVCLPPSGNTVPKTSRIRRLGSMPIQRAWRRRTGRQAPDLRQSEQVEAIMLYERGDVLSIQGECQRCKKAEGVSRECVIAPSVCGNMCSNCIYEGIGHECQITDQSAVYPRRRSTGGTTDSTTAGKQPQQKQQQQQPPQPQSQSQPPTGRGRGAGPGGSGAGSGSGSMKPRKSDFMIVLKSIEQMKQSSISSDSKSTDLTTRARRIEEAALKVARAARQWGRGEGVPPPQLQSQSQSQSQPQ